MLCAAFRLAAALAFAAPAVASEASPRLLRGSDGSRVTFAQMLADMRGAHYVLLGETHDNAVHHRIQEQVLFALPARALVLEQFDRASDPAIAAASVHGYADALAVAGKIGGGSWNWAFYRPLVEIALDRGAPIGAGNLSRAEARAVVTKGFEALPDAGMLAVDAVWNDEREAVLASEIVGSHCNQLPPAMVPNMVLAQRARDAVMADMMLRHSRAVLIAGAGHARKDLGVPLYLRQRASGARVVSLGLVEEGPDVETRARDFDYAWITVRVARPDPCAGFAMPAR